jgi:hypothetical protein
MTHHGKRSPAGLQRQAARLFVITHSRRDRIQAENINIISRDQIIEELGKQFKEVILSAVKFERGEVLMDSRGRGSLQQS